MSHSWNFTKAEAKAKELGNPVALRRPDGTSSGLMVMPDGKVRRAMLKPQGKAARKEFKALRRRLRELGPDASPSTVSVLQRRAHNLCQPNGGGS